MAKSVSGASKIIRKPKGTSIGRGLFKSSSLNKSKKRNRKAYRGQGR
jgi:hypothetical protein